VNRDFLMQFAP